MRRRVVKRWILWLLPFLLARAFVPVGFMLSSSDHGLSLTFCPGEVAAVALHDGDPHAAHSGGDNAATDSHAAHHSNAKHTDLQCPFGVASLGVSAHASPGIVAVAVPTGERFAFLPISLASVGPLRADRIRGPPSLS